MSIPASTIIERASLALVDPSFVRWTAAELISYLNAGQDTLVDLRPEANAAYVELELVAGARQDLATNPGLSTVRPAALMDIVSNLTDTYDAVTSTTREALEASSPGWRGAAASTVIQHFMFDARTPASFLVYPPAATGATVEAMVALYPAPVAAPASNVLSAVLGNIGVRDGFQGALLDYVLYRAYLKDSDVGETAAKAQAHYAAFRDAAMVGREGVASTSPQPT